MENGPCIDDLPIKIVIFRSYVSLPEGTCFQVWRMGEHRIFIFRRKYQDSTRQRTIDLPNKSNNGSIHGTDVDFPEAMRLHDHINSATVARILLVERSELENYIGCSKLYERRKTYALICWLNVHVLFLLSSVVHHFSLQAEGKVGNEVKAARAKAGIALRSLGQ